jgi:hypothetical protein
MTPPVKNYVPLVPDHRLVDLNNEHRLLELARLITDECQARIPLWELEKKA